MSEERDDEEPEPFAAGAVEVPNREEAGVGVDIELFQGTIGVEPPPLPVKVK